MGIEKPFSSCKATLLGKKSQTAVKGGHRETECACLSSIPNFSSKLPRHPSTWSYISGNLYHWSFLHNSQWNRQNLSQIGYAEDRITIQCLKQKHRFVSILCFHQGELWDWGTICSAKQIAGHAGMGWGVMGRVSLHSFSDPSAADNFQVWVTGLLSR